MKKFFVFVICLVCFASSSYAFWGQKKKEALPVVEVKKEAVVKTPAKIETQQEVMPSSKVTKKKRVIRFEQLTKLLLNENVSEELGLSVEQRKNITSIQQDLSVSLKELKQKYSAETKEIRREFAEKMKPYKTELREKSAEIKKLKVNNLNNLLNKDQQEKLSQVLEDPSQYLKK